MNTFFENRSTWFPKRRLPLFFHNFVGAFGDAGLLFPLLFLLVSKLDYTPSFLFVGVALCYMISGVYYKIPMPIQPLKSILVTGLLLGASLDDITFSALMLGVFCFLLSFLKLSFFKEMMPSYVISGVQLGLGVKFFYVAYAQLLPYSFFPFALFFGCLSLLILCVYVLPIPILGIVSLLFFAYSLLSPFLSTQDAQPFLFHAPYFTKEAIPIFHLASHFDDLQMGMILSLLLPQMALTFSNSVLATEKTAKQYFKGRAKKVTIKSLLRSISFFNLILVPLGSMPCCHGSSGLTSHVKSGAKTYSMNLIIGFFLLLIGGLFFVLPKHYMPIYPPILIAILLGAVGIFHAMLCLPTIKRETYSVIPIALMGIVSIIFHNMLYVFLCGLLYWGLSSFASFVKREAFS